MTIQEDQIRRYDPQTSAVFQKTKEKHGGLSNMAGGFPLQINGVDIRSSEAIYQACRFPHLPDVQKIIIDQRSPLIAKRVTNPHRDDTRADWTSVNIRIMKWCLRVKLACNMKKFSELLLETEDQPIVEKSTKDEFWGTKLQKKDNMLVGMNVLGRLLMQLREEIKEHGLDDFRSIEPLRNVPDFLLFGNQIERVEAPKEPEPAEELGTLL